MNLLLVMERELRVESRRPGTAWLRTVGAGVALAVAAIELLIRPSIIQPGLVLFSALHHCLFGTIWVLVPLMTADCVSQERREGTLGLLFLTPLRAGEILLAKVLAQGLRAAAVCVAVLPVLILPLLVGGVGWPVVGSALLADLGAFCWALAAGILASVLSRSVSGGLSWALMLSLLFLVVHSLGNGLAFHLISNANGGAGGAPSLTWLAGVGLLAAWNPEHLMYGVLRVGPAWSPTYWLLASAAVVLVAGFGLAAVWWGGARVVKRSWQELPPSARRERVTREISRPRIAPALFRALMRRSMERNPVGWLERRRWTSRVALWGWLGVLVLAQSFMLSQFNRYEELRDFTRVLGMALIGLLAMVSVASLQRERENGVLELLLTTPLSARQIVQGRLRGIWIQFLPSFFWFGFTTWFIEGFVSSSWGRWPLVVWELILPSTLYLAVPVGGLWLSLGSRSYIVGLLRTIALMIVLPWGALVVLQRLGWQAPVFVLCLPFAVVGAVRMRPSLGRFGSLALLAALAFILVAAVEIKAAHAFQFARAGRGLQPGDAFLGLIWPCVLLAIAGEAHRRLLRDLGSATASRRGQGM